MVKKNPELGESTSSVPAQADEQGSRINFLISENIRAFSDYGKSLNVNNPDGPRYIAVSRALQLADSMLSGMNDVYCPIELQKALLQEISRATRDMEPQAIAAGCTLEVYVKEHTGPIREIVTGYLQLIAARISVMK